MQFLLKALSCITRAYYANRPLGIFLFAALLIFLFIIIKYHIPTSVEGAQIDAISMAACAQMFQERTGRSLSAWETAIMKDPSHIPDIPISAQSDAVRACITNCRQRGVIGNTNFIIRSVKRDHQTENVAP